MVMATSPWNSTACMCYRRLRGSFDTQRRRSEEHGYETKDSLAGVVGLGA